MYTLKFSPNNAFKIKEILEKIRNAFTFSLSKKKSLFSTYASYLKNYVKGCMHQIKKIFEGLIIWCRVLKLKKKNKNGLTRC